MENNITDKAKSFVKDFFLNLTTFASLYWLTISLIILLFQIIDTIFPDQVLNSYGRQSISTFALSSVIVITPVFLYFAYKTNNEIQKDNSKKDLWIRRWLIYITMFFAGISIITDGIILINFFLNGDLTTRFILKVLVMILIPGFIFWYLRYLLNRDYQTSPYNKTIAFGVILLILATVISAFIVVGSPVENRLKRIDEERVQDLSLIQNEIFSYWQQTNKLPDNIKELEDDIRYINIPSDPKTKEDYKYTKTSDLTFTLCATFDTAETKSTSREYYYNMIEGTWAHGVGEVCFDRTIDPERHSLKPII